MPIYEYECQKCGRQMEVFQKITERPLSKCEHCRGKLNKLVSLSSFHLKGTGWYATDYAGKSRKPAKEARAKPEKEPEPKEENKAGNKEDPE